MSYLPGLEPTRQADEHDGSGDEWYTPPDVWRAVRLALGKHIVDPCWSPLSPVTPERKIDTCEGGDGLSDPWGPLKYAAFVNPPYSDTGRWLGRCAAEYRKGRTVIALVPMRPETEAWFKYVWPAAEIIQPIGRIRFVGRDGKVHGNGMITTCFVVWDSKSHTGNVCATLCVELHRPCYHFHGQRLLPF